MSHGRPRRCWNRLNREVAPSIGMRLHAPPLRPPSRLTVSSSIFCSSRSRSAGCTGSSMPIALENNRTCVNPVNDRPNTSGQFPSTWRSTGTQEATYDSIQHSAADDSHVLSGIDVGGVRRGGGIGGGSGLFLDDAGWEDDHQGVPPGSADVAHVLGLVVRDLPARTAQREGAV